MPPDEGQAPDTLEDLQAKVAEYGNELHALRKINRSETAEAAGLRYGLPREIIERLKNYDRDTIEAEAAFLAKSFGTKPQGTSSPAPSAPVPSAPVPTTPAPTAAPSTGDPLADQIMAATDQMSFHAAMERVEREQAAAQQAAREARAAATDSNPAILAKIQGAKNWGELQDVMNGIYKAEAEASRGES